MITYYDGRAGNYARAALDGATINGQQIQIETTAPGQKVYDKDTQSGVQPLWPFPDYTGSAPCMQTLLRHTQASGDASGSQQPRQ